MWDLSEFAKEAHQNAVDHGWWEPEPSFDQVIALCHCELSEALEEYRAGRPMLWYECGANKAVCDGDKCENYGRHGGCSYQKDKPEGIAVEMVDCLLRILDYAGKNGWECKFGVRKAWVEQEKEFPSLISELHASLSTAWGMGRAEVVNLDLWMLDCAEKIITWLWHSYGEDWTEILKLKNEHNRTREYRHGGKKI